MDKVFDFVKKYKASIMVILTLTVVIITEGATGERITNLMEVLINLISQM